MLALLLGACTKATHETRPTTSSSSADLRNPETMLRIARAAHQGGDDETAVRFYQRILMQQPHYTEALLELSDLLVRVSSFHDARVFLNRISPEDHPGRLRLLGKIALGMDEPQQAIDLFQRILKKDPHHAYALEGSAIAHDSLGQHQEAHALYQKALELPHTSRTLLGNYGLSLALGGKTLQAIDILKRLCQGDHPTARDRQNLGIAYGLHGDLEQAAQWLSVDLDQDRMRQNLAYLKHILQTGQKVDPKTIQGLAHTPSSP